MIVLLNTVVKSELSSHSALAGNVALERSTWRCALQVDALVGENGSGRSTLLRVAAGVHVSRKRHDPPRRRDATITGQPTRRPTAPCSSHTAQPHADLSATANIFVGRLERRRGRNDWARLHQRGAVELTETAPMRGPDATAARLRSLKELGGCPGGGASREAIVADNVRPEAWDTVCSVTTLPEGKWAVEERSTLEVSIKHLGVATVRGRFGQVEGKLDVGPRGELSAELWVATASLTTGDDKRDAFLVSPDFLDASAHPRATFRVRGGHVGEDNSKVKGTLTVAGTAAEVEAGVEIDSNDAGPLLRVETVVDRHVYGLRFPQVAGAGDSVVAKSVRITGALALRPR